MVLQAFIDESYSPSALYVLAGYIATADAWARFAKDWEELLPRFGTLAANGKYHFKMSEMAANPERMERVKAFYRVIEKHDLFALSCQIDMRVLKMAKSRLAVPGRPIDWDFFDNPYGFSFRALVDMFHNSRVGELENVFPLDQTIDFIFDDMKEKSVIIGMWDQYMASRPASIRYFYGAAPRFENDQKCLPLQAADFLAWWVREWHEKGTPEKMMEGDFGDWKPTPGINPKGLHIDFNEDQLVEGLKTMLRDVINPGDVIYDRRLSWPPAQEAD